MLTLSLMNKQLLSESTSVPTETDVKGRWSAVFITPGRGSSGDWTEEVLERDGAHALKKGARCFITHQRQENGEADPFRMWGVLAEDARYEAGVGLVGEIDVLKSWRERVEEVAPHTALSVYLWVDTDEYGVVTRIYEDVENGVDLVSTPGRPGSALVQKMYESAKRASEKAAATSAEDKEEGSAAVTKDITDAIAALGAELGAKFEAVLASNKQELQAEVDADAIAEAKKEARATYDAQATALAEAKVLPAAESRLKAALIAGEDITDRIAEAKADAEDARALATEGAGAGRNHESGGLGGRQAESKHSDKDIDTKGLFI